MTSQNEEVVNEELAPLIERMKELNVKSYHLVKTVETAKRKIAEAESEVAVKPVRKKAPSITVSTGAVNERETLIKQLEREDPEASYITQSASVSASKLALKGFEVVKGDNGETMRIGEDIVCRTDKAGLRKWGDDRRIGSLRSMKNIDKDLSEEGGGQKIQSLTEVKKTGRSDNS